MYILGLVGVQRQMLSIDLVWEVRDAPSACGGASGTAPMWLIVTVLCMGCHGHMFQDRNLVGSRWNTHHPPVWKYWGFWIHSTLPSFLSDGLVHCPAPDVCTDLPVVPIWALPDSGEQRLPMCADGSDNGGKTSPSELQEYLGVLLGFLDVLTALHS